MTTELVLRLDKKRAELLQQEARKRRKTRNALVRQALDNLFGEPRSEGVAQTKAKRRNGETPRKATKGVGWAEHFAWLKKHGRPVKGNIEDEIRDLDRNRGFR